MKQVHFWKDTINDSSKTKKDPRQIDYFGYVFLSELLKISGLGESNSLPIQNVIEQFNNTSPDRKLSFKYAYIPLFSEELFKMIDNPMDSTKIHVSPFNK